MERQVAGNEQLAAAAEIAGRLLGNVERVLRGKHDEIKLVLAALACHGHVLFEDVPGTGKTVLARAIARSVEDTAFARIQCTPDLQPSDVTGVNIYDQKLQDFEFRRGPLFANVVLVDEINRAMPKTQSALLEAMAEGQVTVDGVTHTLPDPFLVMATENPIEQEGTYPLDRLQPVVSVAELDRLEASLGAVYVDDLVRRWTIKLVRATRELPEVSIGGSVRGSLALERASRAWALLDGRAYTTPDDVERMFTSVLGHRLVFSPSFIAESRGRSRDEIVNEVYGRCVEVAPPPDLAGARDPRWMSPS